MGFRKPYSVKRPNEKTLVNGRYTDNGYTEFSITASVQAPSLNTVGIIQQSLPEGKSVSDIRIIYTGEELQVSDIILLDGAEYEVVHVYPNQNNVINHYKAIVAKR